MDLETFSDLSQKDLNSDWLHKWELLFAEKIRSVASNDDPAHDFLHFQRVVATAKRLCATENGELKIVIPAAWLHDLVIVPKNSPDRARASQMSADAAIAFLESIEYPDQYYSDIAHAIAAHSFSANIETKTLEARIVQDADRLDGLGAIGIARCFATAGLLRSPFYSPDDPFCVSRSPDDSQFTVDHFYKKLFKVAEQLKTNAGVEEGKRRVEFMRTYLEAFEFEIKSLI